MIKRWKVRCQVNMCANDVRDVIVESNSERKARIFAERELKAQGCFCIQIYSCQQI